MPSTKTAMSRRRLLRGATVALALPWLEAMAPRNARAAKAQPPRRLAILYVANGVIMPEWTPKQLGPAFELSPTLAPLAPHRSEILVVGGLDQRNADALGDGPGDHARAAGAYLTGAHPKKSATAVEAGVSVDQLAAARIGHLTRLPSLELACGRSRLAGVCDSGYGCAYQFSLSWRDATTPLPYESDPRMVFDRLFLHTRPTAADRRRRAEQRSVLDFVAGEARQLGHELGPSDRRKVDEYFTSVRDVEKRVASLESLPPPRLPRGARRPSTIPDDHRAHVRLLADLMVLAFQTDSTRISVLQLGFEGIDRAYLFSGSAEGHHELSHHMNREEKITALAKIDRYNVEQLAYVLGRMRAIREGNGTLLDSAMVLYGSGHSDGNRHLHADLPLVIAGRGAGAIKPGRHVRYEPGTPMCNLFVTLLHRMGAPVERFGDSTAALEGLDTA